jgi:NADH:ubiquinone oxidoreductase subunit 6 (subunit J)
MSAVVFFIAAIGAVGGAVGVVVLRNPFFNVLALAIHLLALAALFLLLNAQFIAAAQVVVYVGAVMVLYVFVVAYVGDAEPTLSPVSGAGLRPVAFIACGALFVELAIAVLGSGLDALGTQGAHIDTSFGTPAQIGEALLTKFLFVFEAASLLLLVAAIGAVMLARRRRGIGEPTGPSERPALPRPPWSGTMREAIGTALPSGVSHEADDDHERHGEGGW